MLTDEQPRTPDVARTMQVQRKTEEKKQWAPISIYLNLSLSLSLQSSSNLLPSPTGNSISMESPLVSRFRIDRIFLDSAHYPPHCHSQCFPLRADFFRTENQILRRKNFSSLSSPSLNLTLRRPNTREERISPRSIRKRSVVENSRENFV